MNIEKAKEIFPDIRIVNIDDEGNVLLDYFYDGCLQDPFTTTLGVLKTDNEPSILDIQRVARALDCDYYYMDRPSTECAPDYNNYRPYYMTYIKKRKNS